MSSLRKNSSILLFISVLLIALGNWLWMYSQTHTINHGDEVFMAHFFLIEVSNANHLSQIIDAIWWTYIQHRMITYKVLVLAIAQFPSNWFWPIYIWGAMLIPVALALFIAFATRREITQHSTMTIISICLLWVLTPYAHPTISLPICSYSYYLVVLLSLCSIYFATLPTVKLLPITILTVLAVATFANGLFVTTIIWAIFAYRVWLKKDIPAKTLVNWSVISLLLIIAYLGSTNTFSNQYYGTKSSVDILQGLPQAALGFLSGLGALPVTNAASYPFKLLLGSLLLILVIVLFWRDRKDLPLIHCGAISFYLVSLLAASILRHSAADHPHYLYLTALLQLTILLWLLRCTKNKIPCTIIYLVSIAVFANGVINHTSAFKKEVHWTKSKTQKILSEDAQGLLLQKALFDELRYLTQITPFSYEKIFNLKRTPANCPIAQQVSKSTPAIHNIEGNQAIKIIQRMLPNGTTLYLCSNNEGWEISAIDPKTAILIDKTVLTTDKWSIIATIPEQEPQQLAEFQSNTYWQLTAKDHQKQCQVFHDLKSIPAMKRLEDYFCNRPLR